jgi:septum formation protein
MAAPRLILASASPRRAELLTNAGINFEVHPAHIRETVRPREKPKAFAERMARDKARTLHRNFASDFILGADTVVIVAGRILGKPRDVTEAARMLRLLSGRSHLVTTGVCLISPGKKKAMEDLQSVTTKVFFDSLNEEMIAEYIATGEPMDKAGAYGIQGFASRWIPEIVGCYFNVVGLPVPLVVKMLRKRGYL